MAFNLRNFSFSRMGLPILAVVGLIVAVFFIAGRLPDRELSEPEREPPRATGALANADRVAGSGGIRRSSCAGFPGATSAGAGGRVPSS